MAINPYIAIASLFLVAFVAACGPSAQGDINHPNPGNVSGGEIDRTCDDAPYPSEQWTSCEANNFANSIASIQQNQSDQAFVQVLAAQSISNIQSYNQRRIDDPLWTSDTNVCAMWSGPCVGDPYRYPELDAFYSDFRVQPVAFYDRSGFRLSGRVWASIAATPQLRRPIAIIVPGGAQPAETLYWWAAQALARAGYVVLTFDVRTQGRSDGVNLVGDPLTNIERDEVAGSSTLFVHNTVDAVDFMTSTPERPYPSNVDYGLAPTDPFNPFWEVSDPGRVGVAGHSAGGVALSVVQSFDPWPGVGGGANPVDVVVAWDGIVADVSDQGGAYALSNFEVSPRVPAMNMSADYGLLPRPYVSPPGADDKLAAYPLWLSAGVPAFSLTIRGGSHYEWSQLPGFPSSEWPRPGSRGEWIGGWGLPLAEHYTVAWFDRWLKLPGELGYEDADARLIDADPNRIDRLSYHFRSVYDFNLRSGEPAQCEDVRAGCR